MNTVTDSERQLEMLRGMLEGHRAFGKLRGRFGEIPIQDLLDEKNPTATLKSFDEWLSDSRVMLNMLAVLKRDGHLLAMQELMRALKNPSHVIIGETVPLEETEPGVLLMVDPDKTILLARWMHTSNFEHDALYWIDHSTNNPERGLCGTLTPQFFELFPTIRESFVSQRHSSHIISPSELLNERLEWCFSKIVEKFASDIRGLWLSKSEVGLWYYGNIIAFYIKGATQSDVLRLFSREEQESIATWQLEVPKLTANRIGGHSETWIGLHPEEEHEAVWKKLWPSYVSTGVSQGLGAIIMNEHMRAFSESPDDNERRAKYYVPPMVHPKCIVGDLWKQRMQFPIGPHQIS